MLVLVLVEGLKSSPSTPRGVHILLVLMVLATDDTSETQQPDEWREDRRDPVTGAEPRVPRGRRATVFFSVSPAVSSFTRSQEFFVVFFSQ